VAEADIRAAEAGLYRLNPVAALHRSGWDTEPAATNAGLLAGDPAHPAIDMPAEDGRAVHSPGVATFAVRLDQPLDPDRFRDVLSFLILRHADRLLRMKGIVRFKGEPSPRLLNVVHDIHESRPLTGVDRLGAGSLVFIGIDLPETQIRADLVECQQ
jgi:G3E family GTPase